MSDPKRANLITVGAPKSAKKIVNKTVRLTINLVESNESKYPELNYKELVIAEERKKRVENGKTGGLDPFSDNDEDVERVARKFEQKYGNNSTYGKKKRRSKDDEFADIGAGYDDNDSFIDNTDGYDEMIPPDIDTYLGGFYINCGALEFKTVPQEAGTPSEEPRRNKRRISSSSSEVESSDSTSDSESQDTKDPKAIANGDHDSHKTEHRKKKNKKVDKQKAKKIRRTDSSAANSGKQTSDDNIHADGEGESVDSRTSHSDSLTSKPSDIAITSDSSRDIESKSEIKLPQPVTQVLDALEASIAKYLIDHPNTPANTLLANNDTHIQRLEQALLKCNAESRVCRAARSRAARALGLPRAALPLPPHPQHPPHPPHPPRAHAQDKGQDSAKSPSENAQTLINSAATTTSASTSTSSTSMSKNKRKVEEDDSLDVSELDDDLREAMIEDTIKRLMDLIEEFKPSMFANYNMECERVREEKKKLTSDGAGVEKRLPKRRFPWCQRSRALLARLRRLAGAAPAAARLLADRVLPLFPKGFVRMPTLMRQANISKDVKIPEIKRQRLGSASASQILPNHNTQTVPPTVQTPPLFPEQIQFPSSLTVTATVKSSPEKETNQKDLNLCQIMNTFSLSRDLIVEREKNDKKEEPYIPPNNIGSITITPVPSNSQKDKKPEKQPQKTDKTIQKTVSDKLPSVIQKTTSTDNKSALIRVKSPAALNDSVNKKEVKTKKPEKPYINTDKNNSYPKEKRIDTPLQIDTTFQPIKKEPSPKNKEISPKSKETLSQKQIDSLRVKENNIPRPALVPVHHSPTFAKPDKRPPEVKKPKEIIPEVKKPKDTEVKIKKDIMIVSDLDPLSDQEPVAVDDSSSDVEVIENDKSVSEVPSKDNKVPKIEDSVHADIDHIMRNIREMEHSQEPTKYANSYGGVIANSNAQNELL